MWLPIESKLYVYINLLFLSQAYDSRGGSGLVRVKADTFLSRLSSWVHPSSQHAMGGWLILCSHLLQPAMEWVVVISSPSAMSKSALSPLFPLLDLYVVQSHWKQKGCAWSEESQEPSGLSGHEHGRLHLTPLICSLCTALFDDLGGSDISYVVSSTQNWLLRNTEEKKKTKPKCFASLFHCVPIPKLLL